MHIFQILTSARMEVTCVATLRFVRTQSEATDVFVPEATDLREWAFLVWVSHLGTFALTVPQPLFRKQTASMHV